MPYKNVIKQKEYQKKWNNKSDNEKYLELGIPFGTACHKLRKQILFKYIKKAGENFCYDCKKEILTAEDLSIQHKKVWLHIDPKLFWDLDNIAFSHRKCNKVERHPNKGIIKTSHGTSRMYHQYKCRCLKCNLFKKKYQKNWRKGLLDKRLSHLPAKQISSVQLTHKPQN